MRSVFTYVELEPSHLEEAFSRSGVIEVELSTVRANLCRRLLENLNRVRAHRFTRPSILSLVSTTLFGIVLNLYVGLVHPRLMVVLGFYVQQQPVYEVIGSPAERLRFTRYRRRQNSE
jgi:hypothetical protein